MRMYAVFWAAPVCRNLGSGAVPFKERLSDFLFIDILSYRFFALNTGFARLPCVTF